MMSWILAGMVKVPDLRDTVIFKGGTALRKCYFTDYRFSEDLDFTALPDAPRGAALEGCIRQATEIATHMVNAADTGESTPFSISFERYREKRPHPSQEAFILRVRMPWQRRHMVPIKVEVTTDQPVLSPADRRAIIHAYEEPFEAEVAVYSLKEIVAEKLQAVLDKTNQLGKRNWDRLRTRDYYDLWRVLTDEPVRMDTTEFATFLRRKCDRSGVSFHRVDDFFDRRMTEKVTEAWLRDLGDMTPRGSLPDAAMVMEELRPRVDALISPNRRQA